jgi:5-methylcytosine-specific restriction endonuclease McrA
MPIMRLCASCGRVCRPEEVRRSKCPDCARTYVREKSRRRRTRQQRGYTDAWLAIVKQAIRAHPFCAECGTSADLTGDHIVPLSKGGTNTPSNIQVLCRGCNGRKQAKL